MPDRTSCRVRALGIPRRWLRPCTRYYRFFPVFLVRTGRSRFAAVFGAAILSPYCLGQSAAPFRAFVPPDDRAKVRWLRDISLDWESVGPSRSVMGTGGESDSTAGSLLSIPWVVSSGDEVLSGGGSIAGVVECPGPVTRAHTDASFTGGSYVIQAGFAEDEIAAISFTLEPSQFPITIRSIEFIFAALNLSVQATTLYSVFIWEGTPRDGILVAAFTSDDPQILPLIMQPQTGAQGTNVQVVIDPGDSEQIVIEDIDGTHMFSVGFRIDEHNEQTLNPCIFPPPQTRNSFPTTDLTLAAPNDNWLFALDCPPPACPGGWRRFSELPLLCRPRGDWVMRVAYECTPADIRGACCNPDQSCDNDTNLFVCRNLGGTFMGEDSRCSTVECPEPVGACCGPEENECYDFTDAELCGKLEGQYAGGGTACDENVCRVGGCCLFDGSCLNVLAAGCTAEGGTFHEDALCSAVNCPQPRGACCVRGLCVANQTRLQCETAGTWNGANSVCSPAACVVGCPPATVLNVSPEACTLDARQHHRLDDDSPAGRQGIGSFDEPITVRLSANGARTSCFAVYESTVEPGFGPNDVALVEEETPGVYKLTLNRPISSRAVSTIAYNDIPIVSYISHPANVNRSSLTDSDDVEAFFAFLMGEETPPFGIYSVDVDHSGHVNLSDALRILDLLNGADDFLPLTGTDKPSNAFCP